MIGSVIAPVLKVCGNPKTFARMSGDMDINAGRIMTGAATVDSIGAEIYEKILAVAAGAATQAERLGPRASIVFRISIRICAR